MAHSSPIHFLKSENGLSLIELLLVLAISAVIIMISINRYQHYRDQLQIAAVQSDIRIITQALEQYFYQTGCDQNGLFPEEKSNPSITDLGLTDSYQDRQPLVAAYSAHVIDSGDTTAENKPLYLLQIVASLNSNLSSEQIDWYGKLFNAQKNVANPTQLTWQSMPNNSVTNTLSPYWVLNGARAVFRKTQNGLITAPHNYCAQ